MARYDIAGRTIVITGSTGGLGRALAAALRVRGARLALFDLDADQLGQQSAGLGEDSEAKGWVADVRDLASLETAMTSAVEHFGQLDVVIANAGVGTIAPLASLEPEAFERVIDVNLNGVWRTFRAGLPHVTKQHGYLLAISSMAAFIHSPLQGPYTASKAGVWALCDSTRLEVRHLGVNVGSVHPTFFATPMMEMVHADPAGVRLWGGNKSGLWKMVDLDTVVRDIVAGIERRADHIVIPRQNSLVARMPGVFRPLVERIGFTGSTIPDAIALASPTGRN